MSNGNVPEIELSGPSVMALAAKSAGVDLNEDDPLAGARSVAAAAERKPSTIGPHHCHAVACTTVVPPEKLMCKEHWFRLPHGMRKRVLISYTPGQCNDTAKIKQSWILAARQAIEFVLQMELPDLVKRLKLPAGYDGAQVRIQRVGMSTIAIQQEGKPLLVGSLATGEVREVQRPAAADEQRTAGDAQDGGE